MYHQPGDSRYAADLVSGNSHGGMESQGAVGRYMYGPYYGHKGPDGSPYMNPPGGGMQTFGSTPPSVALSDGAYAARWNTPGYMRGAGLKPGSDYVYQNQPSATGTFPDARTMMNMTGYPSPSYGPGVPFTTQYPYAARGYSGSAAPAYIDGFPDGGTGNSTQLQQPPSGWPSKPSSVSKGQEIPSGHSPQWSYHGTDGYSSSTPNTPAQQLAPATPGSGNSQLDPAGHSVEQATNPPPSLLSQQTALSPRGPLDSELKKQASVSSLRDALLSTPNSGSQQQYSAYSPQVPGGHSSPMTPSATFPHTPDASTPTGGTTIMSPHVQPHYEEKSDGHIPAEPELINSFAHNTAEEESRPLRVSPFQVESILGIRNDKPIDYDSNMEGVNSVDSQDRNSPDGPVHVSESDRNTSVQHGSGKKRKAIDAKASSSLSKVDPLTISTHPEDCSILQESLPSPSLSPVDQNHPCILNQYQFSDEEGRKEFLDLLFSFLTMKGIGLLRIPTLSKAPLDLFKAYIAVQNLGGFINVMQKNLWPEVMQLLSPSSSTCAGSIRTLMRIYARLLLPYECHVRNDNVADCLSKVDTSLFLHTVFPKVLDEKNDGRASDDGDTVLSQRQMNGEVHSDRQDSRRLNSQTSESSTGENSSQEQESKDKEDAQPSDIPEETQTTPVDTYPQEVSSDEPLPEISAQETESLLAMPTSPYLQPPVTTSVPSTPSTGPATPPSSFPPPYTPQVSQEWGQNSDAFTSYPSSYSMDMSTYRPPPHPAPVPPGYNPFAPPSQHDMSMDYHLDMPSPMMRSPYDTSPYHMGMPPAMHGLPSSRPNPYLYRTHMNMMQRDPFGMRGNDMMYSGMNSEWAWQQGSQFSGMMHHHGMPLPSRSSQGVQPSPTSRAHLQQPPSHNPSSANQPSATTGEATKQWLEHPKAKLSDRTSAHPKGKTEYKTVLSKADHPQMLDSLKRPLPNWSGCVEGTKPHLAKRKHLLSVDCGNVEPWRVMMSLKSGLLSESTWALDTLNILLHDDSTVGYFHLKHHHSLLNTLVDHLSKVLQAVFKNEFDSLPCHPDYNCGDMATTLDICGPDMNEQFLDYHADTEGSQSPRHSSARQCHLEECVTNLRDDHRLSHIQLPTADERLLFAEYEEVRQLTPEYTSFRQNIRRIDETPVSEIKHRENLRNQLPLHYFGRSPRRREHSILEDIQIREELEKEIDERLHSDVDNDEKVKNNEQKLKEVFLSPSQKSKQSKMHALKEESEIYQKEPLPLWSLPPNKEILQGRCLCLSNILRSLSFIPGNDVEFSQHPGVLTMLGRILMLYHSHLIQQKRPGICPLQLEAGAGTPESVLNAPSSISEFTLPGIDVWWWDCLDVLRENSLVILSNISGQLDLSVFPESVSCPIITGLLHWVTCPSAMAVDPLPDTAMALALSPQRLVLEALAKISISEINVDFILATPPVTRLDMLFMHLVHFIGQKKHPVMRQFALVLLSNLAQGNEAASRLLAQQKMIVPLLVECIESSEQTSCNSRGQFLGGYNPEDPNSLSVAMLRRAATTLHCLAKVPLNRAGFLPYRDRTLYLATSQYVEPSVSSILMDMIFELGKL